MDALPEELLEEIVNDLEADEDTATQSLCAIGAICTRLTPLAQRKLFSSVTFRPRKDDSNITSRRLCGLVEFASTSPHLLEYIGRVVYVLQESESLGDHSTKTVLRKEASYLEQLIPAMTSVSCFSLTFIRTGSSPDNFDWDAIPAALQHALNQFMAIPHLTNLHIAGVQGLPSNVIHLENIKELCLTEVDIDFGDVVIFDTTIGMAPPTPNLVSPLKELQLTSQASVAVSPVAEWLLRSCRLDNLRKISVYQECHLSSAISVDDNREQEGITNLIKACPDTLEELALYTPRADPCSRLADPSFHVQTLDLSSLRRLKVFTKRISCAWGDQSGIELDATLQVLAGTLSNAVRGSPWLRFELVLPLGQTLVRDLKAGFGCEGLKSIDRALASSPDSSFRIVKELVDNTPSSPLLADDLDPLILSYLPLLSSSNRFDIVTHS